SLSVVITQVRDSIASTRSHDPAGQSRTFCSAGSNDLRNRRGFAASRFSCLIWTMSKAIGIDLGTTNSLVAHVDDAAPFVIPDAQGDALMPSVVSISREGRIY